MDLNKSSKRAPTIELGIGGVHCLGRTLLNQVSRFVTRKNLEDQNDTPGLGPVRPVGVPLVLCNLMF